MMSTQSPLYPLAFAPIYMPRVWGGRTLEKWGRTLPGPREQRIGESWELCDLAGTGAASGGGEARSVVVNGPLAGHSLNHLIQQYGQTLMGRLLTTSEGGFPILIKMLDARENLSVQVHPSASYARANPGAHLKSESWYIVEAEAGAAIYKGVKPGVDAEQFRRAILANTVEQLMVKIPVKAGDCHYLPSGTVHALGAGILVAEVQTPSDTTFRVYDWGRTGRELHVEPAMQSIKFNDQREEFAQYEKRSHIAGAFTTVSRLVTCEHFRMEKIRMSESYEQEIPYDQPAVWIVLEGRGVILPGNGAGEVAFAKGQTLLIPAHMNEARVKLHEDTIWLEVTFPQALAEPLA